MSDSKIVNTLLGLSLYSSLFLGFALLFLFLLTGSIASVILVVHLYPEDFLLFYEPLNYAMKVIIKVGWFFVVLMGILVIISIASKIKEKQQLKRYNEYLTVSAMIENKIKESKRNASRKRSK